MSGKYWEKYQEKKLKLDRSCKTPTHMSDKQAYISSLETQLENTNHSKILISTFSERIEQLQKQLNTAEERISNLTRVFKLQTPENSESFHGGLLSKLDERITALEAVQKTKIDSFKSFSINIDSALKETEKRITKYIEDFEEKYKRSNGSVFSFGGNELAESLSKEKEKIKEAAENAWLAQQTCNKLAEDTIDRVSGCEKRIRELKLLIENSSHDDIETRVTANLDNSIENLAQLIKGYIKTQDQLVSEINQLKDKHFEIKDPGVFSFGSTFPRPVQIEDNKHERVKSESNSRQGSKDPELKNTRKRSSSPSPKAEKKIPVKKDENKAETKTKKKIDRKTKLESLYQNFSAKNS